MQDPGLRKYFGSCIVDPNYKFAANCNEGFV